MNTVQRQLLLLAGFMVLLAVAVLFASVYAPEPLRPPALVIPLPEPLDQVVNQTVYGWKALFSDLGSASTGFRAS